MSDAKVTLFYSAINKIDKATIRALEKAAEAVHTEIVQAQVIPFDTGHLQNDSTFVDTSESSKGHVDIVSSTPYARRLYYHPEYHFQTKNNRQARGKWFEPWLPGGEHEDFPSKAFAKLLKKEAGL